MPFIETDLVKFIVLVIPGILGMWVYKPFVDRGDDREHHQHDVMTALLIGTVGYVAATWLSVKYGTWFSTVWGASLVSLLACIITGGVAGYLNRHGGTPPAYTLANLDSKFSGHPTQVVEGSGFSNFIKETKRELKKQGEDTRNLLVVSGVYKLESGCREIGATFFESTNGNEIELFPLEDIGTNYLSESIGKEKLLSYTKFVNLHSGIVTEVGIMRTPEGNETKDAQ